MNIIHLNDAITSMREGIPFSISFVTLDENRKKGGNIISLQKCLLASLDNDKKKETGFEVIANKTDFKKKANHYEHATRNLLLENGHIKKFHIRLMLYFNDKKVFY
jgi:hypothetical protein